MRPNERRQSGQSDHCPVGSDHQRGRQAFFPCRSASVLSRAVRLPSDVVFKPADAMALPFEDGSFDAVVCQFGVMFFPDKPGSYREVYRVLAPGGHYLFSVWNSHHCPVGSDHQRGRQAFFPCRSASVQTLAKYAVVDAARCAGVPGQSEPTCRLKAELRQRLRCSCVPVLRGRDMAVCRERGCCRPRIAHDQEGRGGT